MGSEERILDVVSRKKRTWTVALHTFADLSHVSPIVFLWLLKECYACGKCKATVKFHVLQQQVHQVLRNGPHRGASVFIACCLYALPIYGSYCEGLSHLILSALRRFLSSAINREDSVEAKLLATKLFLDIVEGSLVHDEKILIKILEVFDIDLTTVEKVKCDSDIRDSSSRETAKQVIEKFIYKLVESQSYTTAVELLEHFSIRQSGESFLLKIVSGKEYRAAEKWATFMGKPMLCVLVQEYVNRNLLKHAYDVIKKNNLQHEFPEVCHQYKESSLKKLAEKGCWDVAEARTNNDKQLLEYLVYLAMEAGYSEKVEELCDRYSLKGFNNIKEPDKSLVSSRYLHLSELFIEEIVWVDEVTGLRDATAHIEECKVIGVDCEWKPNYVKGSKSNKVSIMQIASERKVFIVDLIKLHYDAPDILDDCMTCILHSPSILKLGYNFQCDVKQLAVSYGELQCFRHFEMLLDVQNVFKEPRGGLSGLSEKILGVGLNKTRRNSNWEQRPLSQQQLEYAALDAAVLIHIFRHVRGNAQPGGVPDGQTKIEWKSHIISHMGNSKKAKGKK